MMTDIEDRSTCYNALGQLCNAPPPNTPLNTGVGAVWRVYSIEKSLLLLSPPLQQGGGQKGLAPPPTPPSNREGVKKALLLPLLEGGPWCRGGGGRSKAISW